jgi:hypothetical protein
VTQARSVRSESSSAIASLINIRSASLIPKPAEWPQIEGIVFDSRICDVTRLFFRVIGRKTKIGGAGHYQRAGPDRGEGLAVIAVEGRCATHVVRFPGLPPDSRSKSPRS